MQLLYTTITQFDDLSGMELLPPSRRMKTARYRKHDAKLRSLAAGLLLRYAFGERALNIVSGERGKPYLPDGPHFNLSHSGDLVLLAVSTFEVGADIERVAPYSAAVAKRCFTADEQAWLNAQNDDRAFYRLWTGKESVMKAFGLGFALPPKSFDLLPVDDGWHTVAKRHWFLSWLSIDGYEICTASKSEQEKPVLKKLSREELLA